MVYFKYQQYCWAPRKIQILLRMSTRFQWFQTLRIRSKAINRGTLLLFCIIFIATVNILKPTCLVFWMTLAMGLFIIALSWTLVMPLDLFFRSVFKWTMSLAGRLSISQALFTSTLVGIILISSLPTLKRICEIPESMWYLQPFLNSGLR